MHDYKETEGTLELNPSTHQFPLAPSDNQGDSIGDKWLVLPLERSSFADMEAHGTDVLGVCGGQGTKVDGRYTARGLCVCNWG
jgi:hypothetical protein